VVVTRESQDEIVGLSDAPSIPGLSFHRQHGEPDVEVLAKVIQRSRDADLYDLVETPEDIANDFRHLQNCDPSKDMLLVEVDGILVGFCKSEWHDRTGGVRTYEHAAHLLPEWRGTELRRTMLRENERRLREIADQHPKELVKLFETRANSAANHWKSLLEEEGYQPYRYNLVMIRSNLEDIPDLPVTDGLEVRPVRPEHHMMIFKAAGESFREEPNFSEEMWNEEALKYASEWRAYRPEIWQGAWDGDEVSGAVLNFIDTE